MKKEYIKNIIKLILIAFCIIFIISAITNAIISSDIYHLADCDVQECQKCLMIHTAIEFFKNINYIIIYVALLNAIIPLIYMLSIKIKYNNQETLVSLKVIMNN